jgi:preprotein translocase subunit SecA
MFKGLLGKVVGDPNEREIRKLQPLVDTINSLEPAMERRTHAELRDLTDHFRARLAGGETMDDILVEAFAAVREVAKRTVDMRPFDVQLIGGIVLHRGMVAEMRTGEGKTLVATMPIYLNALLGHGAHLVTVNDYLARRDSLWMGKVYHALGLSIGLLQSGPEQPAYLYDPTYQRDPYPGLRPVPRQEAYAADVTYGTNNEFGFDYLRDNLALSLERRVQRPLYYAIVDEVDNIFIDEARTPLIISGPSGEPVEEYSRFANIAPQLESGVHYELDEKERSVYLTEEGLAIVEQETGIENIYDEANYRYVHYMQQALKAQVLFQEGRDYIRQRKRIILIDQHTGRLMPDRRLSEGLHQAIEAKERVPIRPRDVTSATITIQNYFRMYEKLAGMSGTAVTESEEFFKIYELEVLAIPTNMPVIREDHADVVYRSEEAKLRAVAREILACHSKGQPVLVGTTSVEMSERVSTRLTGERLQMAALAPRIAYALQDAELGREERAELRETMNGSLETMNSVAWRRMVRTLDLDPNALSADNVSWIIQYLELRDEPVVRRTLEQALREGIDHEVLNAKEHTREAAIIARAGEPGAVTVATNMAGRGVDIKLGGELTDEVIHRAHLALQARGLDPFRATPAQMDSAIAEVTPQYAKRRERVIAARGLHVLGTERHEARRIDNQLRGRSGRQGEPGSSRFYLSLEDDLMRRFGRREMLSKLMETIGDDFPIEHGLVSRTIERAQSSVEGYNFDIRKHLLEYDDVLNRQRETIYGERLRILQHDDLRAEVRRMLEWQVNEYMEKYSEDLEQQRALFAGLDDVIPLVVPPPKGAFQGPLTFGNQLTAFPSFTIDFLADQLADQSKAEIQETLLDLTRQAAASYGEQIRQTVDEVARDTLEKYEERLDRYRALLDEKIDDFEQLAEDRNLPFDIRRLVQHIERTFPLKLTTPSDVYASGLDDVREHWLAEVEIEFHRQVCLGLMERAQIRLPAEVQLDRLRPARMEPDKLKEELHHVLELAARQARDEEDRRTLARLAPPSDLGFEPVSDFVTTLKETSNLDFARLDRLIGHNLGAYLDDLLARYQEAVDADDGRLQRDLERLQAGVVESRRGGRSDILAVLRQLNDLVHLEISDLQVLLTEAVTHEYDKWAQHQLAEYEAEVDQNPLSLADDHGQAQEIGEAAWSAIAEHLLATQYTQRLEYDRGHRRRATWMPRFPFPFLAQAYVGDTEPDLLRQAILASLERIMHRRQAIWGQQELQRWVHLSLDDLDEDTYDGLIRFLGEGELGENRDRPVEDLPRELHDHLATILLLRQWQDRRMGTLPDADALLDHLGQMLEAQILSTPVSELDGELQQRVRDFLQQNGYLDDPQARASLGQRAIRNWDRETRDEVAGFLGRQFIEAHEKLPVTELEPAARETAIRYLQSQRRFVDETRVQHFLVYERLTDLPEEVHQVALSYLARSRLDQLNRRKIANLDVSTRQQVMESLQRQGLFADESRHREMLERYLAELEPEIHREFGAFLAREQLGPDRSLSDESLEVRDRVIHQLEQNGILADPDRLKELPRHQLHELDGNLTNQVRDDLANWLQADLAAKTMEELPAETRRQIHQVLEQRNYFVDSEKVGWYERKTLAQLSSELMHGLEQHMGHHRLAELEDKPFRELPAEVQGSLEGFFDEKSLFNDRAERLRLTQTGSLADLPQAKREAVARFLGRQWLVQIRNRRPPDLPERERQIVWAYVRDRGQFTDEFKEELFDFQRLDEFDAEVQEAVEVALFDRLTSLLETTPIGDLPDRVQAVVRTQLSQANYFVNAERLQQVLDSPLQDLPMEMRHEVEKALGSQLLESLDDRPVSALPAEIQDALWRYLNEIGYFVDEKKQQQMLERRLVDLTEDQYEQVVQDLARFYHEEIRDTQISDLDDDLRQGLREAVEVQGYFESGEERAHILSQPLGALRRTDLEALAFEFGTYRLEAWIDQETGIGPNGRLNDLPLAEQEAVLSHLQSRNWFLDQARLDELQGKRLADLEADLGRELVDTLRRQQIERLRRQRLAGLNREQRHAIQEFLQQQGVVAEEGQMRLLRHQKLQELDLDIYHELLRDLGNRVIAEWGTSSIQDMNDDERALVGAYLGRRLMGRIERRVLLHTISRLWVDYLTDIEDLRRGIGLEAYGQRDPLVEYKRRAFELFEELGDNMRRTAVRWLFRQLPEPLNPQ